jgi:hypothetical protein
MKRLFASALFAVMLLAALALPQVGCKTVDGESVPDIERIAATAREAATFGVQEALLARPDWADEFTLAHRELTSLAAGDTITAAQLLDILNRLPVKELKSEEARITIAGARILIAGAGWSVVDAERLNQLRPVIIAIAEGLVSGGVQP